MVFDLTHIELSENLIKSVATKSTQGSSIG